MDWNLQNLSHLSTIISAPLGLLTIALATLTLLSSARTARLRQMHDLFKDYLRLQFDYHALGDLSDQKDLELRRNLGSFKMYTLEEMTLWLRRERRWTPFYRWSRFFRRHIESWQDTIDWHLNQSSDDDLEQFVIAENCYGEDFVAAVKRIRQTRLTRQ